MLLLQIQGELYSPVHAVVEESVLEELEAVFNGEPLPHRCVMHLLD
jgi:hypothetical protein